MSEDMTRPTMRELWQRGETLFGAWCSIPSSIPAEFMANEGFDYVGIDCQHGLAGPEQIITMLQALGRGGAPGVVRVPIGSDWWIERALDCGAEAVIVPMVDNAAQAARAASHFRYPPEGIRSYGPIRAELVVGPRPATANLTVVCLVMIETAQGVANVDEILEIPGVDGIYIGPADLAISLGLSPRLMPTPGPHADAIATVLAACQRHERIPAVHSGNGEMARQYADMGFRMVTVGTDLGLLRAAARDNLKAARGNP